MSVPREAFVSGQQPIDSQLARYVTAANTAKWVRRYGFWGSVLVGAPGGVPLIGEIVTLPAYFAGKKSENMNKDLARAEATELAAQGHMTPLVRQVLATNTLDRRAHFNRDAVLQAKLTLGSLRRGR